jgi:TolB protein
MNRLPMIPAMCVVLMNVAAPSAQAVMELDITQGNLRPMPIAIAPVAAEGPERATLSDAIAGIVAANLERSGMFKPIEPQAFIQRIDNIDAPPQFRDWRVINAEALIVGKVSETPDGLIRAQVRLWDVYTGRELAAEVFSAPAKSWRRVGHIISDAMYQRLTGERGYFDSQIAFIAETGPKDKRIKRLAVMDQDGQNLRYLTTGRTLALTPRFSPDNREITFTAYSGDRPNINRIDLATGEQSILADFPGMTFAPRFSPDGRRILLSLEREGSINIYELTLADRQFRQLTATSDIDTAPCYSPDGRFIVFESDRSGTQQLYIMNADGSNPRQITGGDGRYSTPAWSPRGDLIAFTKQIGGEFLLGVVQPDGAGERILTEGYHNEGPSWAPNGRVIAFFREAPGQAGGARLFTIDLTGYNERQLPTPSFASDPAWSALAANLLAR